MERVFQAAVVAFVAAAAVFFYYGNVDGVFISVVLACLSFFLIVRFQVKGRLVEREMAREAERLAAETEEMDLITDETETELSRSEELS